MIFKQYREIVEGKKTQTRRICGDKQIDTMTTGFPRVLTPGGKLLHEVGRTYAVVPGRGKPGLLTTVENGKRIYSTDDHPYYGAPYWQVCRDGFDSYFDGWLHVRIRILSIRREPLQAITDEDAIAEGCPILFLETGILTPRMAYRKLWNSINTRPGIRWEDNPDVFVYTFECLLE